MDSALGWPPAAGAPSCAAEGEGEEPPCLPESHLSKHSFRKSHRLLTRAEYQKTLDDTQMRISKKAFVLLARRSGAPNARLGLILSKRQIPCAVSRNRIKRVLRESFRTIPMPPVDLIFIARRQSDALSRDEMREQVQRALAELAATCG